jgi:hypothetical protein
MRCPRVRLTEWRGLLAVTFGLIGLVATTAASSDAGPPPDVKGADIADVTEPPTGWKPVGSMFRRLQARLTEVFYSPSTRKSPSASIIS